MQSINICPGIPITVGSPGQVNKFIAPHPIERNYTISGVTRDSGGAALAACTVNLFNTATNSLEQITISDASGNYSFVVDKTKTWYLTAYKAGAPDVSGTTVSTLAGA